MKDEQWCIRQIYIEPTYSGVFIGVDYLVKNGEKERTIIELRKVVRNG